MTPILIRRGLIPALWLCWALYWWFAAHDVKANEWRESRLSRLVHVAPLMLAFLLLSPSRIPIGGMNAPILPRTQAAYWIGAVLTAAGLAFAVWARRHIGRNWSGTITIKLEHELVTSGPYRIVRHPIYSGLLLAFTGSAIAIGQWRGLAAVVLAALAIWRRVYLEEAGMRRRFGAAYEVYARRVAALIPFVL